MQALLTVFFEIIQGASTLGPTPVSHSTPMSQVSVAFLTATGQASSALCALPAVGLIPQNLRELSSHAWEQLCWALLPVQVLPGICTNAVHCAILKHTQLTTSVGDRHKEEGEQTIRKKWQAASSGCRRAISSCLEKKPTPNPKPTHAGYFELLKQITEMITEQTVFLEIKRQITLKDIITAALLGQTKGSPGLVFCVIRGSPGKLGTTQAHMVCSLYSLPTSQQFSVQETSWTCCHFCVFNNPQQNSLLNTCPDCGIMYIEEQP